MTVFRNNAKSKKGFTLVELCIVIALIGIVVSMCVVFITMFATSTSTLQENKKVIFDLTTARKAIKEWISYNDTLNLAISTDPNGEKLMAGVKETANYTEFYYDSEQKLLIWAKFDDSAKEMTVYQSYSIEAVKSFTFATKTNEDSTKTSTEINKTCLVQCTASYLNNRSEHLLFSVFSGTDRSRYSDSDRT